MLFYRPTEHTFAHTRNFFQTHIRIFDDVISPHGCVWVCICACVCVSARVTLKIKDRPSQTHCSKIITCACFLLVECGGAWSTGTVENIFGSADFANSPFLITAIQHCKWFFSPPLFWLRIILDYTEANACTAFICALAEEIFRAIIICLYKFYFFFFFFFVRSFTHSLASSLALLSLGFNVQHLVSHIFRGGQLSKMPYSYGEHLVWHGIVTARECMCVCALCEMPRWNKCASVCNKIL